MNPSSLIWSTPPEILAIKSGELHVWRANLNDVQAHRETLQSVLSLEEVERAERFIFSRDRDQFIISHAFCRNVLSRYLGINPERLSFARNSFGKPALLDETDNLNLQFNLTHSGRFAIVAVAKDLRVGVDVECIRKDFPGLEVARRFFSPVEVQVLISLPEKQLSEAFFRGWTRKEAFIKAVGAGLSIPLDEFAVSVQPLGPGEILNFRTAPGEAACWSVAQVDPAPGYSGAVVLEGHSPTIRYWDWFPPAQLLNIAPIQQINRSQS
jgi:4'-phosphopantetheinyl transferase